MSRLLPSLIFVLGAMAAGTAAARSVDREGIDPRPVASPQAQVLQAQVLQAQAQQPPLPGRDALEKGKEAGVERARAKMPLPPELKALRDEFAEQVGELRALVDKKYEEAGAKAVTYALWAAAGLFAIMVLASVVGGAIVTLLFRRSRNS
jgi:hypothetical protein